MATMATAMQPHVEARAKKLKEYGRRAKYRCNETKYTAKLAFRAIRASRPFVFDLQCAKQLQCLVQQEE